MDGCRHNGLKPSLLTPEVLEVVRLRLAEPPPDGGLWSSRKVADVIAVHLGLERVLPQRGWEVLKALGYSLQRPRSKDRKSATAEGAQALQNLAHVVAEAAAAHPGVAVEVFCTDEHRLGPKPVLRSVWALKGQRSTALGHHRFQWLTVTAFVGPGTGEDRLVTSWRSSHRRSSTNGIESMPGHLHRSAVAGMLRAFS